MWYICKVRHVLNKQCSFVKVYADNFDKLIDTLEKAHLKLIEVRW